MKLKKKSFILLLCMMLLIISGCGSSEEPQSDVEIQEDIKEATGFVTTDLYGNEVTEAIFSESKLTVLNVWATYCGPCIREMPGLGELAEEYEAVDVRIVGIPMDAMNQDTLDLALTIVEETGADYTHLLLTQELYYWGLQDVQYVPTTFFVNSQGEIIDTVVGSMDKESWKELIDEKLASL